MSRSSNIKTVQISRGKRSFCAIYELPDGRQAFLAHMKIAQIWRDGELSISDAIRNGTAAWPIDDDVLLKIRAKGVLMAGVYVRETGDIHLARTADFFDREKVTTRNFRGYTRRCLPLRYFRRRAGRIKL